MKFNINRLVLAIIPLVILFLSFLYTSICPYYFGNKSDPEYCYLFNSLNILNCEMPRHTDHPGTPLQILGAVVLLGKGIINTLSISFSVIQTSVLRNPEDYLHAINFVLNILICVITFLTGLKLFHHTRKLFPALILQFSLLCFSQVQVSLGRVSPEPLLVFTVLLLLLILIPEIFVKEVLSSTQDNIVRPILTGIVFGLGLAIKVTFFPLLFFVFIFEGARKRILIVACCILSFILFTIPILPSYMRMFTWFINILMHEGYYGKGPIGLPEIGTLFSNAKSLSFGEPFLIISFVLYLFGLMFIKYDALVRVRDAIAPVQGRVQNKRGIDSRLRGNDKKRKKATFGKAAQDGKLTIEAPLRNKIKKLLWIGCLIIFTQLIVTSKHPQLHYLLPSMVVTGILDAGLIYLLFNNEQQSKYKLFQIAFVTGLIIAFAYNIVSMKAWIQKEQEYSIATNKLLTEVKNFRQYYHYYPVGFYQSSLPEFALAFGNSFSGYHYGKELTQLYPDAVSYSVWKNVFYTFEGYIENRIVQSVIDKGIRFILVGNPHYLKIREGLIIKPLSVHPNEGIYRLVEIKQ
ncbi:MAG: DUF2029 domain-containing protein [Deltaproteobacteria bacterium]|nr:DUF2029 domain-containing protein [Deltaproteobacteria bacterium]